MKAQKGRRPEAPEKPSLLPLAQLCEGLVPRDTQGRPFDSCFGYESWSQPRLHAMNKKQKSPKQIKIRLAPGWESTFAGSARERQPAAKSRAALRTCELRLPSAARADRVVQSLHEVHVWRSYGPVAMPWSHQRRAIAPTRPSAHGYTPPPLSCCSHTSPQLRGLQPRIDVCTLPKDPLKRRRTLGISRYPHACALTHLLGELDDIRDVLAIRVCRPRT